MAPAAKLDNITGVSEGAIFDNTEPSNAERESLGAGNSEATDGVSAGLPIGFGTKLLLIIVGAESLIGFGAKLYIEFGVGLLTKLGVKLLIKFGTEILV